MKRADLREAVAEAWRAFDRAGTLRCRVSPAAPILFFGDFDSYRRSPLRVLTVGLNPSRKEFPAHREFVRFPLVEGSEGRGPDRYIDALCAYYRTKPYRGWFSAFETVINGVGASYYSGELSTALHTDICSPVATDPTWSRLGDADQKILEADGCRMWHTLLDGLRPQVVVLSVARLYMSRIDFTPLDGEWEGIHTFDRTAAGALRLRPYEVQARWFEVGDEPSLFVCGRAAQKPFGLLDNTQKREAGAIALEAYRDGR